MKTPGLSAHASASFVGSNVGYFEGSCVGNDYGHTIMWEHLELGLAFVGDLHRAEAGRSVSIKRGPELRYKIEGEEYVYHADFFLWGLHGGVSKEPQPNPLGTKNNTSKVRWSRVEMGVHTSLGGMSIGFDLIEFLDFLAGWVGIDISKDDDLISPMREKKTDD